MGYPPPMNHPARIMADDAFLEWREGRPGRWELVNGHPILAMAGARQRHDAVTVNLIAILRPMLRGGPCRPWSADIAVKIPGGNVRQPDVAIDCAPVDPNALAATAPTVVFEVPSPSTRALDIARKLDEYKRVETMRHIVFIDAEAPRATVWSRDGETWSSADLEGLEAMLHLPAVNGSLPLADLFEGVSFPD